MTHKVVLDRDDVRRTLVRIAHEIVEKNRGEPIAIVGIHRRGALLAGRLRELVADLLGEPVPLGDVDISFYRDDLGMREPGASPVVHASHVDFSVADTTVVLVDDVLFTGRTVRAAIDALFDYGRPGRVQLAVLADRGHRELPIRPDYVGKNLPTARNERVYVKVEELDGEDEVLISVPAEITVTRGDGRMKTASAVGRRPHARGHRAHPRPRRELRRGVGPRDQEGAHAARAHGDQPLLRGLHSHQLLVRARRKAPVGGPRLGQGRRILGGQGRVAEGHRPDALGLRPGRDRLPLAPRRRRRAGGPLDRGLGDQRGRRQARAPHPGAARPVHAATPRRPVGGAEGVDRGGRAAQPRGSLEHPRLRPDGLPGDGVRATHPDPARRGVAGLRGAHHPGRPRRGRRGLCPADAARADGRLLRPLAARVRRAVPDRRPPPCSPTSW